MHAAMSATSRGTAPAATVSATCAEKSATLPVFARGLRGRAVAVDSAACEGLPACLVAVWTLAITVSAAGDPVTWLGNAPTLGTR